MVGLALPSRMRSLPSICLRRSLPIDTSGALRGDLYGWNEPSRFGPYPRCALRKQGWLDAHNTLMWFRLKLSRALQHLSGSSATTRVNSHLNTHWGSAPSCLGHPLGPRRKGAWTGDMEEVTHW
ncbi:hypothetical protein C8Q74DRAFT_532807 [Fomes fomentarius]|nr:hypothetical protein C8Q74DRAFT_532807 [Fomes fomentarius]